MNRCPHTTRNVSGQFQCEGKEGHQGPHWWGSFTWGQEKAMVVNNPCHRSEHCQAFEGHSGPCTQQPRNEIDGWDVIYDPPAGMCLDEAAKLMIERATREQKTLSFYFNGRRVYARPGDTMDRIYDSYFKDRS